MAKRSNATLVASNGDILRPTPADALPIPLRDPVTVELATGRVVEMVVGELEMLYELGEIPDDLTRVAVRELFPPANPDERERGERLRERLRLIKWVVRRVLVHPRVVDEPQGPDEIAIDYLYNDEVWEIYRLANSPARALASFRRQQARRVGPVSRQQDVGATAEPEAAGVAAAE